MNHELVAQSAGKDLRAVNSMAPLTLAYIGDAVYELAVRTMLVDAHDAKPGTLHNMSARRVCSHAQSEIAKAIGEQLNQEEQSVFARARNAKPHTLPKHADPGEYALATGLEAVLGYVYLKGDEARLGELLGHIFEQMRLIGDKPAPVPYKG